MALTLSRMAQLSIDEAQKFMDGGSPDENWMDLFRDSCTGMVNYEKGDLKCLACFLLAYSLLFKVGCPVHCVPLGELSHRHARLVRLGSFGDMEAVPKGRGAG